MSYFPPIDAKSVWGIGIVLRSLEEDPTFLDDEDCPYELATREFLLTLSDKPAETAPARPEDEPDYDPFEGRSKWEVLEQESKKLFGQLMLEGNNLDTGDKAERMSYFRTATSLLDKIVAIEERANNLKQISSFYSTVLAVMEEVLEAEQRTKVLDRLRAATKPQE